MSKKEVSPVSQDELLAFLLDARSYPHRPRQVRLKQTHSSYVLLAAPYAYKIKKPVNFGFLDFSTLEKRRYFSEREVELNRRLCPDVHLGVVPISLRAGRLTFGPGDEIVEYAVKMRQLEDRYFFLRLLKKDQIGTKDLDRIVSVLKAFYEAQKPTEEIAAWGRIESLKISTDENFRQTEDFIGFTISRPAFETIRFYTDNFYTRNAGLFESRLRDPTDPRLSWRPAFGAHSYRPLQDSPFTIVSNLTIGSVASTLPTTSPFLRWTSTITIVRIYPSNLRRE